jgi:transposase
MPKAYASAIHKGAPTAIQVADRFHLLQNLLTTLEQAFGGHSQTLKRLVPTHSLSQDETVVVPVLPPQPPTQERQRAEQRRARRWANYEQVWELRQAGWSGTAIAHQIGLGRATVFLYLRSSTFTERRGRSDCRRSLLDPHKDYLLYRWNNGYRNV